MSLSPGSAGGRGQEEGNCSVMSVALQSGLEACP